MSTVPFQIQYDLTYRRHQYEKIKAKFPDRIPLIVQHAARDKSGIPDLKRFKFLTEGDLTLAQFKFVIRKHLKPLKQEESLYFFIQNSIPPISMTIGQLYKEHKSEDGFLYIDYAGMETFGSSAGLGFAQS